VLASGDSRTDALVLSGGGAKGAYEIGIMKALFEGASPATGFRPLEVEVYTGTSVGAYSSSFLAAKGSQPAGQAIAELEELWCGRIASTRLGCGNGVYRIRGAPLQLGDPGCLLHPVEEAAELTRDAAFYANFLFTRGAQFLFSDAPPVARLADSFDFSAFFSPEPLDELVRETIDPNALRSSTKRLTVIASDWRHATVRYFTGEEIAGRIGPSAIVASASMPGIFPPTVIEGIPYVDGGVLMNTPLKPAIHHGADVLHVVYLDPCVLDIPFPRYPNTLDTFYRLYASHQAQTFRRDVAVVARINLELEQLHRMGLKVDGRAGEKEMLSALIPFSRVLQRAAANRPYRLLTVHNYRPRNDLGGGLGMLDFRENNIDDLIATGYRDAAAHDCRVAGCVLPRLERVS
jgi:predicted acylesterase/phospholipase RssA